MRSIEKLGGKATVFDSPEEYQAWVLDGPEMFRTYVSPNARPDWFGKTPRNDWHNCLRNGSTKYLRAAEKLVDDMQEAQLFRTGQKLQTSSVVGDTPNIANYLAGVPETMFSIEASDYVDMSTPIRIYVNLVISMGVTEVEFTNRGIAILGLVLALKQVRPVELYLVSVAGPVGCGSLMAAGPIIKVETNPMDLGRATYMICDVSFTRGLTYASMFSIGGATSISNHIPWAWGTGPDNENKFGSKFREFLDAAPEDVIIPGMFLTNVAFRNNPIAWIKSMLTKYAMIDDLDNN